MTEGQAIAAVALGYALQWVKSFKKVPTWAAQVLTVALMVGVYGAFVSGPTTGHVREWLVGVVGWPSHGREETGPTHGVPAGCQRKPRRTPQAARLVQVPWSRCLAGSPRSGDG